MSNLSIIKQLKDAYGDFLMSDQAKEDYKYNSELFASVGIVIAFLKSHNQLTFKNLENGRPTT